MATTKVTAHRPLAKTVPSDISDDLRQSLAEYGVSQAESRKTLDALVSMLYQIGVRPEHLEPENTTGMPEDWHKHAQSLSARVKLYLAERIPAERRALAALTRAEAKNLSDSEKKVRNTTLTALRIAWGNIVGGLKAYSDAIWLGDQPEEAQEKIRAMRTQERRRNRLEQIKKAMSDSDSVTLTALLAEIKRRVKEDPALKAQVLRGMESIAKA